MRLPSGRSTAELLTAVHGYRETMLSGRLLSTGRLLSYSSLFWLVGVLSVALKVVTGGILVRTHPEELMFSMS